MRVRTLVGQIQKLESTNYILRSMQDAHANLDWGRWTANPTTARLLNAAPREMSVAERRAYIARFDSRTSYLLGIWRRADDQLVGFWSIYVDSERSAFSLNVLVGSADDRDQSALKETRDLLYPYFFEELGLENALCSATARNEQMIAFLKRQRWAHEGTVHKPSASGAGLTDILHFRLTREAWRKRCADERASETETGPLRGP
jgi:RimJ/RimL family protein N-acetyltransferase